LERLKNIGKTELDCSHERARKIVHVTADDFEQS